MGWKRLTDTTIGFLATLLLGLPGGLLLAQTPDPLKAFYQQTIDNFEQNLTAARQSSNRWEVVDVLNGAGIAYRYFGNYKKSAELLEQGLAIARNIKDYNRESIVLRELASTYSKLGDYLGIKFYEQQLQALRDGSIESRGAILYNLGLAYLQNQDWIKVAQTFEEYLPIVRQSKDPLQEDLTLSFLASAYRVLGNEQKTAAIQQQRLDRARKANNTQAELQILMELAGVERYSHKNSQKALALYLQMLEVAKRPIPDQASWQMIVLRELSMLYAASKQFNQAQAALEQQLQIARQAQKPQSGMSAEMLYEGWALEGLSQVAVLQGNLAQAIGWQKQAVTFFSALNQKTQQQNSLEAQALGSLGTLQFRAQQFQDAETNIKRALVLYQKQREDALGNINLLAISRDDLNLGLREQLGESYRTLQQIYIAQKQPETALEVAEAGRARAFVELMASRVNAAPGPEAPPQNLRVEPITIAQIKQVAREQNATLVQYSIVYDGARYSSYRPANQQAQETALLIWVVKPTGDVTFRQVVLAGSGNSASVGTLVTQLKSSLGALITSTRASIGAGNRGFSFNENTELLQEALNATELKTANAGLRQLYDLLIQPILDQLPTDPKARVVFIPQDNLFLVPFAALQDASGKYLVDQYTIVVAPAIQVLQLTHKRRQQIVASSATSQSTALVVGNPVMPKVQFQLGVPPQQLASLPGAEKEAQAIAALLQVKPLIGREATESVVVTRMAQAQTIHLATHGLLDGVQGPRGFQSALALTPSGQDDGLLTARELLNVSLKAQLVVLSACDTGRGQINGDGVIGLSRSLLTSGATTIVVSLWKVPDASTSFLMTAFYRNLQQGMNKAEALRQAMLATKQEYPNPLDWAAFVAIGEAD